MIEYELDLDIPINSGCCIQKSQGCVKVNISPYKIDLYMVRHGESEWNELQEDLFSPSIISSAYGMASQKNHPLTLNGIQDAKNIEEKYKTKFTIDDDKEIKLNKKHSHIKFIHADAIFTSPLTRAMQTTAYGLGPEELKKFVEKGRFFISTDIREKLNRFGFDSQGSCEFDSCSKNKLLSILGICSVIY